MVGGAFYGALSAGAECDISTRRLIFVFGQYVVRGVGVGAIPHASPTFPIAYPWRRAIPASFCLSYVFPSLRFIF
jgi:hypothetical protein